MDYIPKILPYFWILLGDRLYLTVRLIICAWSLIGVGGNCVELLDRVIYASVYELDTARICLKLA